MAPHTDGLPKVRTAKPSDEEEIMALCRALHKENGLFSFSEPKVRGYLHLAFAGKNAFVGVIGKTGKIEASTCLLMDTQYYTDDMCLVELWNYVGKEHRQSRNAEALIRFGMSCQKTTGLPLITGIITNDQVAAKVRLYRRLLGYPAGAFFVVGGKWAEGVKPSEEDFMRPLESRAEEKRRKHKEHRNGIG